MPSLRPGSLSEPHASVFRDYYPQINGPTKARDGLTALAEGAGKIAAVSGEAAVDANVDA